MKTTSLRNPVMAVGTYGLPLSRCAAHILHTGGIVVAVGHHDELSTIS